MEQPTHHQPKPRISFFSKRFLRKVKYANQLIWDRQDIYVPLRHYYSPLPEVKTIREIDARLAAAEGQDFGGIDFRPTQQRKLMNKLLEVYPKNFFQKAATKKRRYYYGMPNDQYWVNDAEVFAMMLRHLKPKRIIEIGSGYSTAVALDVSEEFKLNLDITCVEPDPVRLKQIMRPGDEERVTLIAEPVQNSDLSIYDKLKAGDILFIDSTHVSKFDSDVNFELFQILPRLKKGVWVHIHDITWPFDYKRHFFAAGGAWNETYIVRAFLQFNSAFEIALWPQYLYQEAPEYEKNRQLHGAGSGIWLKKIV
jgi:predicted O-methyltransferase YrrM